MGFAPQFSPLYQRGCPHLPHPPLPEHKLICLHLIFCASDAVVLTQVLTSLVMCSFGKL